MIKILFVSIIIMLYEYGLKKSVSILQKRNYAPKEIKTLAFGELTMFIGKGSYVRSGQVEWFWWM